MTHVYAENLFFVLAYAKALVLFVLFWYIFKQHFPALTYTRPERRRFCCFFKLVSSMAHHGICITPSILQHRLLIFRNNLFHTRLWEETAVFALSLSICVLQNESNLKIIPPFFLYYGLGTSPESNRGIHCTYRFFCKSISSVLLYFLFVSHTSA